MNKIMVRYGEIALKGEWVRKKFEDKLTKNISHALAGVEHEIEVERGRIFISTKKVSEAIKRLKKVFGIVSLSPCYMVESDIEKISNKALNVAKDYLITGESFAVRVRRTGSHSFSSRNVAAKCGEDILNELDVSVDLTSPEKEIFIEVRQKKAYIYTKVYDTFGGFPLGTQGSVVSLLSGGIDSPVSTFLMMKRGCRVLPVHFDNRPLADDRTLARVLDVSKKLKDYAIGEDFVLTIFPYGEARKYIVENAPRRLTCIFCKRGMLKLAERFALENNCDALVTGENLGQVASQTLRNLRVISHGVKIPILRPLTTYDKIETMDLAKKISTYKPSIQKALCCTILPEHPATFADLNRVLKIEEKISFDEVLEGVYGNKIVHKL